MTCREREVSIIAHRDANPLRPDRRREAEENGCVDITATFFNENFTAHSLERLPHPGVSLRTFTVVTQREKS
jgi:hypothetical protein